jgi:hypothetical protein
LRNEANFTGLSGRETFFPQAFFLHFAQGFHGLEVATLDPGLVALDIAQGVIVLIEDDGHGHVVIVPRFEADVVALLQTSDAKGNGGGFHAANAEQAPVAIGHSFNESGFDGIRGLVACHKAFPQLGIGDRVFIRKDRGRSGHAMFQGVELRDSLA